MSIIFPGAQGQEGVGVRIDGAWYTEEQHKSLGVFFHTVSFPLPCSSCPLPTSFFYLLVGLVFELRALLLQSRYSIACLHFQSISGYFEDRVS
jgi:hypothetical protein